MRVQDIPDHLVISDCLKATPEEEGGERFVYIEPSKESVDYEGEKVLCKALAESADYYLRYGNLDLDHITQIGPKRGIADYMLYEIGRPVDVKVDGRSTFVKGQILTGDGDVAANANRFWASLTEVSPPQRWYPSIGGAVVAKSDEIDEDSHSKIAVISKVRWCNTGFSKTPVNLDVPVASTVPLGAFAKAWGAHGLDLAKALEAGYQTDSAALTGGGALRKQSLHGVPANYWDFRDRISRSMLDKAIENPTAAHLTEYAMREYGLSKSDAAAWTDRLMGDIQRHRRH